MTDLERRPSWRDTRRGAIVVTSIAGVAIVAVLVIAIGGGLGTATPIPTPGDAQAASPAFTDLPLVAVPPTATAAGPPPTATVAPTPTSGSASPSSAAGVQANRIRIERLGIDLKIIEGDGIDAPIGKAAHYPGSAWPGAGSNVYIYGHAQKGMFLSLWKAREGDVVELDLVDGTTRTYVVDRVLPKVPWDAMKYVRPTKAEQLTLQTSTSYHPTSPRFIVIAHPAP